MDCPVELIDRMSVALLATRILSSIRQMAPFLKGFFFARLRSYGDFEVIKVEFAVDQGQSGDFSNGVVPLVGNGYPSYKAKITSFFHFVFGLLWFS